MKKIENKEKISYINFKRTVQPYCPLGNDYYSAEIDVDFYPDQYYMDYCEVDEKIQSFGGMELTIEELINEVYNLLLEFNPKNLDVSVYGNSNKHFPVHVRKSMIAYVL